MSSGREARRGTRAVDIRRPGRAAALGPQGAVLAAVAALAMAEAVVAFVGPLPGAVLHGVLLLVLLQAWVHAGDHTLLVLGLVPLGRITSLALTPDIGGAGAYALSGLPLMVAVVWLLWGLPEGLGGSQTHPTWDAVVVALSGIPLGLAVHVVLDLPPADGLPVAVAAPVVFVFVGVLEELLYRGLVQPALTGPFGTAGVVLADLLFATAYLPNQEAELVLVVAVLGLGAGLYVRRTGNVAAVAVAHGLLAAGALVVWPVWT